MSKTIIMMINTIDISTQLVVDHINIIIKITIKMKFEVMIEIQTIIKEDKINIMTLALILNLKMI
jgi:hypothetical protein